MCAKNSVVSMGDVRFKVAGGEKERETQEHLFQCTQFVIIIQNTNTPRRKNNTQNWTIVGNLSGNNL